jgi:hypothetical protein
MALKESGSSEIENKRINLTMAHTEQTSVQTPLVHNSVEAVAHLGFGDLLQNYPNAIHTLFSKESTDPQIKTALEFVSKTLVKANYSENQIDDVLNFIGAHSKSARYLIDLKAFEKLDQLNADIANNKITTGNQILDRMQIWGFNDFVKAARALFAEYATIASVAISAAGQMAAQQARAFQMTSTSQQLDATNALVDDLAPEAAAYKKKKKKPAAEAEEGSDEARAKKKTKAEDAKELYNKIASGTEVEKPLVSKIAQEKLYDKVERAERARSDLLTKIDNNATISEVIKEPAFQGIYEDFRNKELKNALTGIVPAKVPQIAQALKAGQGGEKVDLRKFDIVIQTALVSAYAQTCEKYAREIKAGG